MKLDFTPIEALVEAGLAAFGAPGLSLAVVCGQETVYQRGFGYKDAARGLAPDPTTRYACASLTKAMTATAVGMLVDEGKLDWDTPVIKYLPGFRMHDPYATTHVTLRDMLSHNTGLPRHDGVWYSKNGAGRTTAQYVASLAHLPANKGFRTRYEYNNLMFTTAGHIVETVSGMPWARFMETRLFGPLGMADTTCTIAGLRDAPNRALPYVSGPQGPVAIEYQDFDGMAGCGAVNSTVADMAQWIAFNLGKGELDGRRLVSAAVMNTLHTPHNVMPVAAGEAYIPQLPMAAYALGWSVQPFRGRLCLNHSGGIDGFSTYATFMPEEKCGIIVMANLESTQLHFAVAAAIYDLLKGDSGTDWLAVYQRRADALRGELAAANRQILALEKPGTLPTRPEGQYPGRYVHPGYGEVTVTRDEQGLALRYNGIGYRLAHSNYDHYHMASTVDAVEQLAPLCFRAGPEGDICALDIWWEPALSAPIAFEKKTAEEDGSGERAGNL